MTGIEIEEDVFKVIASSALASDINGIVCRKDTRPLNSKKEDVVVAHIGGVNGQEQEGALNVNCFVQDIDDGSGTLVPNITRCKAIATILESVIEAIHIDDYLFTIDSVIDTYKVQNANEHCVNVRVAYRRTTIND